MAQAKGRVIVKTLGAISIAASAFLVASGAHAQRAYIGASGGVSSWNVDCDGTSSCDKTGGAYRIGVGYNFLDIAGRAQLGAEAFYLHLGKTSARVGATNATVEGSGYGLALAASGRFVPGSRFGYHARLGIASMESEGSGSLIARNNTSKRSVRPVVGLGANYFVSPNFSLRAEIDITSLKWPDDQRSGVIALLGGVAFHF